MGGAFIAEMDGAVVAKRVIVFGRYAQNTLVTHGVYLNSLENPSLISRWFVYLKNCKERTVDLIYIM